MEERAFIMAGVVEKTEEQGQAGASLPKEARGGSPSGTGPLKGLRVLDLGLAGAGPMGPALLADWGAEVVKVEIPDGGNISRRIPPLYQGKSLSSPVGLRHKKSVTLDLHTEMGQEAVRRLAREFDVILENYRPGTLEKWNLSYEELKKQKEDLILVRVSGFGQEGPYRTRTSYDTVGAAMGGLLHHTGCPEDPPALLGTAMCDYITAAFNALASLIAVYHRDRTGQGQWADIPQYEAIFRLCEWTAAAYDKLGLVRERTGNRHPSIAPADVYQTRDGQWVAIEAINDKAFSRLAQAMGRDELAREPCFATVARRVENAEAVNTLVADWVGQKGLREVVDVLSEARVPVGPVQSSREILQDPHCRSRGSVVEVEDPVIGRLAVQGVVGKFSRTPVEVRDTGVPLGAHNDEILRQWLQFGEEEMAAAMGKGSGSPRSSGGADRAPVEKSPTPEGSAGGAPHTSPSTPCALEGLRVLELGSGLAGSFSGTLLADFGAEVIKVEEPGTGDLLRQLPPFCGDSALWWTVEGRNKKSITLDLRKERGREAFATLAAAADVVIESFRPGTLERWGLGYAELRRANPRVVLLRASGFGQEGLCGDRPAGEGVASAVGGLTFLNGYPDGPPVRPGYSLASYTAGIFSALGIMAALFERDRSGEGQEVDLTLYEPLLRFSRDNLPAYQKFGDLRERTGNLSRIALLGLFETRDGRWMALLAPEDKDFSRLARAMGREELARDPRFSSMVTRRENLPPLNEMVADWVRSYDLQTVWEILVRHEVPHSPVFDIRDIFEDPHYRARGNLVEVEDPALGRVRMQDVVPKLSASPGRVRSAGPALGQHNQEVFGSLLGLDPEEIAQLKREGVV